MFFNKSKRTKETKFSWMVTYVKLIQLIRDYLTQFINFNYFLINYSVNNIYILFLYYIFGIFYYFYFFFFHYYLLTLNSNILLKIVLQYTFH